MANNEDNQQEIVLYILRSRLLFKYRNIESSLLVIWAAKYLSSVFPWALLDLFKCQ